MFGKQDFVRLLRKYILNYALSTCAQNVYCASLLAATRQQFVIDVLDVWIPAANIGLVTLNDGILGVVGYVQILATRCFKS